MYKAAYAVCSCNHICSISCVMEAWQLVAGSIMQWCWGRGEDGQQPSARSEAKLKIPKFEFLRSCNFVEPRKAERWRTSALQWTMFLKHFTAYYGHRKDGLSPHATSYHSNYMCRRSGKFFVGWKSALFLSFSLVRLAFHDRIFFFTSLWKLECGTRWPEYEKKIKVKTIRK